MKFNLPVIRRNCRKLVLPPLAAAVCACGFSAAGAEPELICSPKRAFVVPGEKAQFRLTVRNPAAEPLKWNGLKLRFEDLNGRIRGETPVAPGLELQPGAEKTFEAVDFTIPANWSDRSYFIKAAAGADGKEFISKDLNFLKIFDAASRDKALDVYRIDKFDHNGVPVYALDGGMSAEFAVEKALATLDCGISHSWYTKKAGSGPRPVFASTDFLKKSLEATVGYYDALGKDREYETVIIGSGVSSIPYLSRVLKAPVLPVHFLAGVSSIRELNTLLDVTNNVQKLPSYAVVGYDFSVADFSVAWIKITGLPDVYAEFLRRHKTKQVVFMGTTGVIGETLARKLSRGPGSLETEKIAPQDVFVLYTSCSNLGYWKKTDNIDAVYSSNNYAFDSGNLLKRMPDIERVPLDDYFRRINDWESGISKAQLDNIAREVKSKAPNVSEGLLVTALEDGEAVRHMYEFASYLMLEFFQKNASVLASDGVPVKGVVFNPYLTSHPFYESLNGLVPYLFWQGSHTPDTLADRYDSIVRREVGKYFKGLDSGRLEVLFNLSRNFKLWRGLDQLENTFKSRYPNAKIIVTDYSADEVYAPKDPENSSTEFMAEELSKQAKTADLHALEAKLQPLTLKELRRIRRKFDRMTFDNVPLL